MDVFKIIKKNNLEKLPKTSGVYLFYEKNKIIYIGKAINIQNRVKNHFQQPSYRDNLFIDKVDKIGFLETNNSEIEALILEANLIKKHQPKYNVVWKDGKNYFYVSVAQNNQKIPYVYITHQPFDKAQGNPKAQYIGPFVEGSALKKTLRVLRKAFPYYTTAKHSKLKCTYCHLDLCPGPCLFRARLGEYRKNIKKLILVLQGKKSRVLSSLKRNMAQASKNQNFEEAGKIRDQIFSLQKIMAHTNVISNISKAVENLSINKNATISLAKIIKVKFIYKIECYDISNIQGKSATGSMVVFTNGVPDKSKYKKFRIKLKDTPNDIAMLKEVLQRRFLHPEWKYPNVILIDGGRAQLNIAINTKNQNPKIKKIKIISIAKGKQELFIEGQPNPIPLKQLPQEVYNLVKQLDYEAHRFAITYHKKLRKKNLLK